MKVSIIVPAFNEEKLIGRTLRSIDAALAALRERGWESEVIVCDNNSTDATPSIASAAGAAVVFEPINQISRARNAGARVATGDWLIFVDADSRPTCELFHDVAEAIGRGDCLAGGSTVRMDEPLVAASFVAGLWNRISRTLCWMAGSFIFCEAAAFREIGGFDETLYASEELNLSRRLKKLARSKKRRVVILNRHPLETSARKLHLYSPWEYIRFLFTIAIRRGKPLRNRAACAPWYDGRR